MKFHCILLALLLALVLSACSPGEQGDNIGEFQNAVVVMSTEGELKTLEPGMKRSEIINFARIDFSPFMLCTTAENNSVIVQVSSQTGATEFAIETIKVIPAPSTTSFTREYYEQIKTGMSLEQVLELIGMPDGCYDYLITSWQPKCTYYEVSHDEKLYITWVNNKSEGTPSLIVEEIEFNNFVGEYHSHFPVG